MDITKIFIKRPCADAIIWAKSFNTLAEMLANCNDGGWIWWGLRHRDGGISKEISVAFANFCAEDAADWANAEDACDAACLAANAAGDASNADCLASDAAAEDAAEARARFRQAEWLRENVIISDSGVLLDSPRLRGGAY